MGRLIRTRGTMSRVAFIVLATVLFQGCAYLPAVTPQFTLKTTHGLAVGASTKPEVMKKLHRAKVILESDRVVILRAKRSYGYWLIAGGYNAAGGELASHYLILAAFDDRQILSRIEIEGDVPRKGATGSSGAPAPEGSLLEHSPKFRDDRWQPMCVALAPDLRTLATLEGRKLALWDLATGAMVELRKPGRHESYGQIAFSADGRTLACEAGDAWTLDVEQARGPDSPSGDGWRCVARRATAMALAPDATKVAVAGSKAGLRVIEAASGAEVAAFPIGGATVTSVAWSPSGMSLAALDARGRVTIWNASPGAPGGQGPVEEFHVSLSPGGGRIVFSPDGTTIAVQDASDVQLWEVGAPDSASTGEPSRPRMIGAFLMPGGSWSGFPGPPVAFARGSNLVAATGGKTVVYDMAASRCLQTLDDRALGLGNALAAGFDRDGRHLAIATHAGVYVWPIRAGE